MIAPVGLVGVELENSTCNRNWGIDGTLCENVTLFSGPNGRVITDDEVEEWIGSFPIEPLSAPRRPRVLPPPPEFH